MTTFLLEKIHEDKRGKIFLGKIGNKEFSIIYSVKGAPRGGHFHNKDQLHFIAHGKFAFREIDAKTQKETKKILRVGDCVNIKSRNPHLFTALQDSILVEVKGVGTKTVEFPKWRKIVNEFLE